MPTPPRYKRILLKLSGESLKGDDSAIVNPLYCDRIAEAIHEVYSLGIEIGVVVGGGNIFRGEMAKQFGFARTPADHVGMLATTMNGLILGQVLTTKGCQVRVLSALNLNGIIETYNWSNALHSLDKGHIVIFVGGTGNPYFTTDTTAAMRASEIEAEVVIKATTKVDGIYNRDPNKYPDAIKSSHLTFSEALAHNLNVMDGTAFALCRQSNIPIHVINIFKKGALKRAIVEREGGTLVTR